MIFKILISQEELTKRIEELVEDFKETLQDSVNSDDDDDDNDYDDDDYDDDENMDFKDTTQLAIFGQGINSKFTITENLVKSVPLKRSPTEKDILDGFLECESKTDNSIDNSTDNAKFNSKAPKENSIYINFIQDMKQQFQIQFTDTHSKKTYFKFYF